MQHLFCTSNLTLIIWNLSRLGKKDCSLQLKSDMSLFSAPMGVNIPQAQPEHDMSLPNTALTYSSPFMHHLSPHLSPPPSPFPSPLVGHLMVIRTMRRCSCYSSHQDMTNEVVIFLKCDWVFLRLHSIHISFATCASSCPLIISPPQHLAGTVTSRGWCLSWQCHINQSCIPTSFSGQGFIMESVWD